MVCRILVPTVMAHVSPAWSIKLLTQGEHTWPWVKSFRWQLRIFPYKIYFPFFIIAILFVTLKFQTVQKELESKYKKCRNLERQLDQLETDHEEKITHLKLSHEEKMRGLMPGSIRQVGIVHHNLFIYEPRCEKTGLRGFQPGMTQTGLDNYRRWLKAWNFGFR